MRRFVPGPRARRSAPRFLAWAGTVALVATLLAPSAARAAEPSLSVDQATLDAALSCPSSFAGQHEPVLLVHGTYTKPEENWGWNYGKVLPAQGYDVCTVRLPALALDDIQVSTEYVVNAIRTINARTGAKVDILGHSQGPLEPRWALKWWPSLQSEVDDVVMLAAPNHGTVVANALVAEPLGCPAACWQMAAGSNFLAALNGDGSDDAETPGDVSYTSIYSLTDELVQPEVPTSTAALDGASNILVQDVCPGRVVDHLGFTYDGAVYAMVMDAFTHDGPADRSRLKPLNVCTATAMPGFNPTDPLTLIGEPQNDRFQYPNMLFSEPALKCYAGGPCP